MKKYIKEQLDKLKPGLPADDITSVLHSIYEHLESKGYGTKKIKNFIDEVIHEKLNLLNQKLDFQSEMMYPSEQNQETNQGRF